MVSQESEAGINMAAFFRDVAEGTSSWYKARSHDFLVPLSQLGQWPVMFFVNRYGPHRLSCPDPARDKTGRVLHCTEQNSKQRGRLT